MLSDRATNFDEDALLICLEMTVTLSYERQVGVPKTFRTRIFLIYFRLERWRKRADSLFYAHGGAAVAKIAPRSLRGSPASRLRLRQGESTALGLESCSAGMNCL